MLKGLRVVRGPDWRWEDQDGGKGSVGTVVPTQVKERTSGAWVRWDTGKAANYRAGGSKFDLRIFDNAQVGVRHPTIVCDVCNQRGVVGIRWKCKPCHDYDLCHICYNEDKHDLTHSFIRIEANGIPGVEVPPRSKSTKCKAWGMFPGARVMRGPDWEWKDQDDVTRIRPYVDAGDKVRLINMDYDKLKEMQSIRCGWKEDTANFRGKVGEVVLVDKDGDIKVDFGSFSSFMNPQCLVMEEKKKAESEGQVKDLEGLLEMLVKTQMGGLDLDLLDDSDSDGAALFHVAASGKTEKLKQILKDKPSTIKYHNSEKQTPLQVAAYRGHMDAVIALVDAKAPLEAKDNDGDTALMFAVIGNEPEIEKYLLLRGSDINASNEKGLTALHLAAAKGHPTCAEVLLKHETKMCDVNYKDKDGNSPLAVAIIKNDQQIIQMLLKHPKINLRLLNNNGFNSLHFAAITGNSLYV